LLEISNLIAVSGCCNWSLQTLLQRQLHFFSTEEDSLFQSRHRSTKSAKEC
jgi:hypothetical protein